MGIKAWTNHTQINQVPPKEDSDLVAAVDTARESWTYTPKGDVKFLFWKGTAPPKAK